MSDNQKKILIVEDDEMIRSMYEMKLKQDDFDVRVASNGMEGLEMVKAGKYDLILLDIIMPQVDGFAMLEELRTGMGNETPVVMLTNLSTEEDKAKGKALGAIGYLVKSRMTPAQMSQEIKKIFININIFKQIYFRD